MRKTSLHAFRRLLFLIAFLLPSFAMAQGIPPDGFTESKAFVHNFYDWYLKQVSATGKRQVSGLEVALKEKKMNFSPELWQALMDDIAASKKNSDEIVGLDFDPILNGQDMAQKYVVGNSSQKPSSYWVEVFGVNQGKKEKTPAVVPEIAMQNGTWVFLNFHYAKSEIPENENLISILKVLKRDREKSAATGTKN